MFLVDIKPKNAQKGTNTLLFLRERGCSLIKETSIPHIIPSVRRELSVAERILGDLREIAATTGVKLQKYEYKGQAVLWAFGPREMKKFLPKCFLKAESSPVQMLRWQANFPFTEVIEKNGEFVFGRKVDTNLLLAEKAAALDIEQRGGTIKGGKIDGGEIFMASYVTDSIGYVFMIDGMPTEEITVEGRTARIVRCPSESALIEALALKIRSDDPLWIFGSNLVGYDFPKLRERGKFCAGVDGSAPKIEAKGGFFDRFVISGRCVIDSAPFALIWLWLLNNRLETVASYLLEREIKKALSPEEIEQLAQQRTPDALRTLAEYNFRDAILSLEVGRRILRSVITISNLFSVSPSAVCTTGKKNLAAKAMAKRYFQKFKTLERRKFDREYEQFDIAEVRGELLEEYLSYADVGFKIKKGIYDVDIIYLTPLTSAVLPYLFPPYISDEPGADEIKVIMLRGELIEKIVVAQALDAYIGREIFDLWRFNRRSFNPRYSAWDIDPKYEGWFAHFYGGGVYEARGGEMRSASIKTLLDRINRHFRTTAQILAEGGLINYGRRFAFVQSSAAADALEQQGLGIRLGRARALSIARGKITFMLRGALLAEGMDPSGQRGERCPFETQLIEELCKTAFTTPEKVSEIYSSRIEEFRANKIDKTRLVHSVIAGLDYHDYSDRAMARKAIHALVAHRVAKGERLAYGYGSVVKDTGNYKSGYVGIVKVPEFFDANVLVEKHMYLKKWEQSAGEIVKAVEESEHKGKQLNLF